MLGISRRRRVKAIRLGDVHPPAYHHEFWFGRMFPRRVSLGQLEQSYHASVWGTSGSGKSKLLQSVFMQHVAAGNGVGLIEPHHDLSFDCLTEMVGRKWFDHPVKGPAFLDRLIYIDWGAGYVPFNVLAVAGEPQTVARNALEGMCRVWPELREAPMFQTLFLSGLMVLIANRLPITYLYQVLTDQDFRERCLGRVTDPLVHQSFEVFARLGRDQANQAGSTLRRAFLLSFSPELRYTLGQPENWLDFRSIMDAGRPFIINLGNVNDAETRRLIGAMLLVQIEQAALSRAQVPIEKRRPCTVLVDEWPAFAAQDDTIGTILSQCRKFNLRLYLSAQSLAQVSSQRLSGALENCKLTVAFALGRDSAEAQARHIGVIDPYLTKAAPVHVTHTVSRDAFRGRDVQSVSTSEGSPFVGVAEQFELWTQDLTRLPRQICYVKVASDPPIKLKTITVPNFQPHPIMMKGVLAHQRERYQRTREEAEHAIGALEASVGLTSSPLLPRGDGKLYLPPPEEVETFGDPS